MTAKKKKSTTQHEKLEAENSTPAVDRIKLELKTPMERLLQGAGKLGLFMLFVGLMGYLEDGWTRLVKSYVYFGSICATTFFSLYFGTDNFYIIDIPCQRMLFHFQFFFIRKVMVLADFSEISALTVTGRYHSSKHVNWWEYQGLMITRQGKVIALSDLEKDAFGKSLSLIQRISKLTGATIVSPQAETIAKADINKNGEHTFKHVPHSFFESLKEFLLFCGIVLLMVIFTVAIALAK